MAQNDNLTISRLSRKIKKHARYHQWTLVRWYLDQLGEHLSDMEAKEKANA